ncbi:hypothetical protein ACKWTF_008332 [Chironomus riparius]
MAAVGKDIEKQTQAETSSVHRIRIVLTACNVRSLEKVCTDLISGAKKQKLRVKGPIRMPTNTLRITTRKTPCGEGSKTWDRFQVSLWFYSTSIYLFNKYVTNESLTCSL